MQSKNKPKPTKVEEEYIARVASIACVVCDAPPLSEVHEPEQGLWMASVAVCWACHQGPQGWHGTRLRWTLRKMTELKAIHLTHLRVEEQRAQEQITRQAPPALGFSRQPACDAGGP